MTEFVSLEGKPHDGGEMNLFARKPVLQLQSPRVPGLAAMKELAGLLFSSLLWTFPVIREDKAKPLVVPQA